MVARSDRPKLLYETGLPARVYIPRPDVVPGVLADAEKHSVCPYKGQSRYLSVAGIEEAAWTYEAPLPEAIGVEGHVCFDDAKVDVELGAPRRSCRLRTVSGVALRRSRAAGPCSGSRG